MTPTIPPRTPRRAPGEAELWILILGDMAVFAVFFGVWTAHHHAHPAVFAAGREHVEEVVGLVNTIVLLTSSLAVALGLHHARRGARAAARNAYVVAASLGLVFAALKVVEYTRHVRAGRVPTTDVFYTDYFAFTGIHLVHVVVGLGALVLLARRAARGQFASALFEGLGVYWHMVDLFWIVLFFLVYLA